MSSRNPRQRPLHARLVILLSLGCGGTIGALARYLVSLAMPGSTSQFPWGTFIVNLSGSFVLGLLLVILIEQFPNGRLVRPVIGTGVLGAYTTFSTYSVEAVQLIRSHHAAIAVLYVVFSAILGLVAVWLGMMGARALLQLERWLQRELA